MPVSPIHDAWTATSHCKPTRRHPTGVQTKTNLLLGAQAEMQEHEGPGEPPIMPRTTADVIDAFVHTVGTCSTGSTVSL